MLSADFSTIQQLDFTLEDSRYPITAQVDEEATQDEEAPVLAYTYPVSYTHLDVYKRQPPGR